MTIREAIIDLIQAEMPTPCPVTGESNLYFDLGFDSLAFTGLIIKIEDTFSVTFGITEMQRCLQVDTLISAVSDKLKGGGRDYA